MSTPKGPHNPIKPSVFANRVTLWSNLIQKADFHTESFEEAMVKPQHGDVVYCDPPYTHSQSIIYGAQNFNINILWDKIAECKERGVYVMLSINGSRESKKKDISTDIPAGVDLITGENHDFGGGSQLAPYSVAFWKMER